MFLIVVLLFLIFCVAVRINQIIQQQHDDFIARKKATTRLIHEFSYDLDNSDITEFDYDTFPRDLENTDEITETEEIKKDSKIISLAREKLIRKYRK